MYRLFLYTKTFLMNEADNSLLFLEQIDFQFDECLYALEKMSGNNEIK